MKRLIKYIPFFPSSQSRAISRSNPVEVKEGIKYNSIESSVALSVSFFINLFVVCVFGAGIYNYDYPLDTPMEVRWGCTSHNISLLNADKYLFYSCGRQDWIKYVWAIGLLAAGQSSTMTIIPGYWWRHLVASIGLFIYLLVVIYFALFPLIMRVWKAIRSKMKKNSVRKSPIPNSDDNLIQ